MSKVLVCFLFLLFNFYLKSNKRLNKPKPITKWGVRRKHRKAGKDQQKWKQKGICNEQAELYTFKIIKLHLMDVNIEDYEIEVEGVTCLLKYGN